MVFDKPADAGRHEGKGPWSIRKQQFTLAILLFLMLGGCIAALVFVEMPQRSEQAFAVIVGQILVVFALVGKYYWPNSVGSDSRNETISKLVDAHVKPKTQEEVE